MQPETPITPSTNNTVNPTVPQGYQQPIPLQPVTAIPIEQPQPILQPSPTAQITGGIQTPEQTAKQKPLAFIAATASFVVLTGGLFLGYASIIGIVLGGYGGLTGYRLQSKPLMIIGYTGMGLNALVIMAAIVMHPGS